MSPQAAEVEENISMLKTNLNRHWANDYPADYLNLMPEN